MATLLVPPQESSPRALSAAPAPAAAAPKVKRLLYLDNLRIVLIALVVVQHLSVTYGAAGSWYYQDHATDTLTATVLSIWAAPAEAAGMGLFFLIAGYFTPVAYDRKGAGAFLRDRLVRLGIPLLAYTLLLDPVVRYVADGLPGSYWTFYGNFLLLRLRGTNGPVWFIAVLLVFTLLYAGWRALTGDRVQMNARLLKLPGAGAILAYIIALGLVTFVVRLWWPLSFVFQPINGLSLSFLPQYASMFALGLLAYRGDWFSRFTSRMAKVWALVALVAIVAFVGGAIPTLLGGGGRGGNDLGSMWAGGWHWLALVVALWQPFILVGASLGLLVLFRERLHRQGRLAREAAASAYTVYLIHPLVLVPFCSAVAAVALYPLLKFAVAVLITLPLCFLVSGWIRRIPYVNRVV
ncbi:MAG: acyltransferase family protein [Ktedonobacterales bacterium]